MRKHKFLSIPIKKIMILTILVFVFVGIVLFYLRMRLPVRPNVILISIDALRADHLGCYGYYRNTTPHIDDFAQDSNLFLNCFSAATWTIPANYSLLTSLYPIQHKMNSWEAVLDDKMPSLFSILRGHDYAVGFFSDHAVLAKHLKQSFKQILDASAEDTNTSLIAKKSIRWAKSQRSPFLLWIYYTDPHRPYTPAPSYSKIFKYQPGLKLPVKEIGGEFRGGWDYIPGDMAENTINDVNYYISQYDGEIRRIDDEIGRLFKELKESGIFNQSLIILTSDHGESLGEHHLYFNHTFTLFNEILKVPLLIKKPGQTKGRVYGENVSLIDILPTVLGGIGINSYQNLEGEDIFGKNRSKKAILAYYNDNMCCFLFDKWKLIKYPDSLNEKNGYIKLFCPGFPEQRYQLFNLKNDPAELTDLEGSSQIEFENLKLGLFRKEIELKRAVFKNKFFELDKDDQDRLRSLGYMQ